MPIFGNASDIRFNGVNATNAYLNNNLIWNVPSTSESIVTSGLVFNLQTAPSSGTTWTDASGNGYDATLQGTPSYTGSYGGGMKLNNVNNSTGTDYISVPYNISSNTITVEVIASFNPTSTWASVWANEIYNTGAGYWAGIQSTTTMTYGKIPGGTTGETITVTNAVRQWIFVINGTQYSLYLNGTQVGTTDTLTAQTLFANGNLYFGARHQNNGTGAADKMNSNVTANRPVFYQMRLYNKALSQAEITKNYNSIKTTYGL